MTMQAIWNGSQAELGALLNVIARNCTCGDSGSRCAAHGMLLEQRVVDGLLFAHRVVDTFVLEEFEIP